MELLHKSRNVRVLVNRRFHHGETFGPQILFNATQDLSGFLAVRSSGEDKDQTQHFALVLADEKLLAALKRDDELWRFARDLDGGGGNGGKGEYQNRATHEI